MAKTLFPTIPLQQPQQGRVSLLGVQTAPITLTDDGAALFGASLGPFPQGAVLHLCFEASFVYPFFILMEAPGLGRYAWSLSGEPDASQAGQTAYCTHRLAITADPAAGAPQLGGPFLCLIPALGVQAALTDMETAPLSPIPLVGPEWIFRLAAPGGRALKAWLELLEL